MPGLLRAASIAEANEAGEHQRPNDLDGRDLRHGDPLLHDAIGDPQQIEHEAEVAVLEDPQLAVQKLDPAALAIGNQRPIRFRPRSEHRSRYRRVVCRTAAVIVYRLVARLTVGVCTARW